MTDYKAQFKTRITVRGYCFDKCYDVVEDVGYIENAMGNVLRGNEPFIVLHTTDHILLSINPENYACVEVENICPG